MKKCILVWQVPVIEGEPYNPVEYAVHVRKAKKFAEALNRYFAEKNMDYNCVLDKSACSLDEIFSPQYQAVLFAPEADRIHLANGALKLDGSFIEGRPSIVRSRLPVAYRPDAPAPVRWLSFLDGLLYAEDIPTLQEFIGYCLIPSNKGQRMMVIKGNGGEGKAQIGAVLGALLGSNMKDGSIGKISENRFARADLEHILLCG